MWKNRKHEPKYKHHYIYKITCLCGNLAGCYYIGKHSTLKEDAELDGYYGGGVIINNYYKKYPPVQNETIIKEILEYNSTIEENSRREKEIIGNLFETDPKCLNKKKGGEGGNGYANRGKKHSKEQTENWKSYMKEYYRTHKGPNSGNGKMVECYDDNGDFVGRFKTKELAGRVFGKTSIHWGLRNGTNKENGFRWRFTEGDDIFSPIESIELYVKPKKVMSSDTKSKMRAAKLGKKMPYEWVPLISIDTTGNEVLYNSIAEAAEIVHPENLKAAQKNIQQAAKGKRRSAYGYTWKYA